MGTAVAGLAPRVAPALLRELRAEDAVNRRNAAFAVGVWAQAAPGAFAGQLPALLQARAVSRSIACVSLVDVVSGSLQVARQACAALAAWHVR